MRAKVKSITACCANVIGQNGVSHSLYNVGEPWSCRHSVRVPREKDSPNPWYLQARGLDGHTVQLSRQSCATLPSSSSSPFACWLSCTWTVLDVPPVALRTHLSPVICVLVGENTVLSLSWQWTLFIPYRFATGTETPTYSELIRTFSPTCTSRKIASAL